MANDEHDNDQGHSSQPSTPKTHNNSNDGSRPQTAHRVSHSDDHQEVTETSDMTDDTVGDTSQTQEQEYEPTESIAAPSPHDIAINIDNTHAKTSTPTNSNSNPPTTHEESMLHLPGRSAPDTSYFDPISVDLTRAHDDSLTEEDVRRHLGDVESSFLPALSPIPTAHTNKAGGVDDTFQFDSPTKKPAPQPVQQRQQSQQQQQPQDYEDDHDVTSSSVNTSGFENFSSPSAAATRRTISRAVSMASQRTQDQSTSYDDSENQDAEQESSQVSSAGDNDASFSRTHSQSDQVDTGSTPGQSLRSNRPKYLRSRFGSQRSSTSSFATNPESHEGSDMTVGLGTDFVLQSGGAVPAMGMLRNPSNPMLRSISIGSMGSVGSAFGAEDYTDNSLPQLEPLPEVDSPERPRHQDMLSTPKPSKEGFTTAPTDTVIARHVRNVQVPESLAKEYKYKGGLETPQKPASIAMGSVNTARSGRNLTLKEQSSTIERLSKENFDLKLKVMFLSDRLDKLSEEGIKEMISENVDLKTGLAVLQRDNKVLRRRVKELEKQVRDEGERPSTAHSGASSTDQTARMGEEEAQEREEELIFLRERVEEYATEIERLRSESLTKENERRKFADIVRSLGERTSENMERQEEADVWKDLLEQETARREQADDENKRLREEVFKLKQDLSGGQGGMHHTTNIYNITKKHRDGNMSPGRPISGLSGDMESSNGNFSSATTLVDELRRESEQLRHENAELRREVGAQTSMLTSRNREKERLYQEIEDLKMAQRRGRPAPSTIDSLLERSASQVGGGDRPQSRGSFKTRTQIDEEAEREEIENRMAEMRDKISEVKLQNQELQRELEICMEDFETAVEGKRQAEDAALALQEDLNNAMNDLVALQSERDEALREQSEMENEFESLRKEAQEEIDALEAEADQQAEEMQRVQADLQDRSENFDALQEEMRKMSEALIRLEDDQENKLRRIQQLEQELDSSNKELEDLEQKLMEANDKNQRLSVQQESSQGEIAFLREEQETDKIRIGDLEAAIANAEQSIREEKERVKELENRLQQERHQREIVADQEKEEVQQFVNELNREASAAKDEARRLRKSLTSREVEATEWKERLMELENNLREALGDLNGTRSSLLKVRCFAVGKECQLTFHSPLPSYSASSRTPFAISTPARQRWWRRTALSSSVTLCSSRMPWRVANLLSCLIRNVLPTEILNRSTTRSRNRTSILHAQRAARIFVLLSLRPTRVRIAGGLLYLNRRLVINCRNAMSCCCNYGTSLAICVVGSGLMVTHSSTARSCHRLRLSPTDCLVSPRTCWLLSKLLRTWLHRLKRASSPWNEICTASTRLSRAI